MRSVTDATVAARRHWAIAGVLVIAALVRLSAEVTDAPALMWAGSWQYRFATSLPGGFTPDKPDGYAMFLRLMGVGAHLTAVTGVQHLLGLAGAVLLYALLRRLGCGRVLATAATAIVVLDAYATTLEQHVLAEALFTFTLMCWAFAAVALQRTPWTATLAGLLLVAAVSVRAAGVFVVPVWLAPWIHTPRWLLGTLLLVSVAALAVRLVPRVRLCIEHATESSCSRAPASRSSSAGPSATSSHGSSCPPFRCSSLATP